MTDEIKRRTFTGGSGPCKNCGKDFWDHYSGNECDPAAVPEYRCTAIRCTCRPVQMLTCKRMEEV